MKVSRRFGVGVAIASLFAGLGVFGSLDQCLTAPFAKLRQPFL